MHVTLNVVENFKGCVEGGEGSGYCTNWNFIVNIVQRNNNNKKNNSKNNIKKTIKRNEKNDGKTHVGLGSNGCGD